MTERRGGRPPKQKTASEDTKNKILKAAKKLAKEFGEPIEEAMLRLIYKSDVQDSVKASVWKSYLEALVAKDTNQNVNTSGYAGPVIYLPEKRPDPALSIVTGGKTEKI